MISFIKGSLPKRKRKEGPYTSFLKYGFNTIVDKYKEVTIDYEVLICLL